MPPKAGFPRLVSDSYHKQRVMVYGINKGERKPIIQGKAPELVTKTRAYAGRLKQKLQAAINLRNKSCT